MKRGRNNPAGFTLMEVVVAIALMTTVMLILFMGLRLAANAWQKGQEKLDDHARSLAGTDALAGQISAAAVHVVTEVGADNIPVRVVAFSGSESELRFCTRRSWRSDRGRPEYMAEYRVVNLPGGKQQLVIAEAGLTDDASVVTALTVRPEKYGDGERVGEPADRVELAYFQPPAQQSPAQWVGRWQPVLGSELPGAVRVRWIRGRLVEQGTFLVAVNHDPNAH